MPKPKLSRKSERLEKFKRLKSPKKPTKILLPTCDPPPGQEKGDRWMTVRRVMTRQEDENFFYINQNLACFKVMQLNLIWFSDVVSAAASLTSIWMLSLLMRVRSPFVRCLSMRFMAWLRGVLHNYNIHWTLRTFNTCEKYDVNVYF